MDIGEVKEELKKRMMEAHSDYMEDPVNGEHADGYASGCEYAIKLLENLREKKYRVKLPGLIGSNGQQYISKSMDDKLFACAYRDYLEQEFTKEELGKFPIWVQQLEFEEVEGEQI